MPRLKAVDADGHVLEPADLWMTRIERKHRDQAVRVVWNAEKQREEVAGEGRVILHRGVVGVGMAGQAFEAFREFGKGIRYASLAKGGFDPQARMQEMAKHQIEAGVLYPSVGLFLGALRDPALAAAHCRVYNDWLAEFCATHPEALYGVAALPLQDVEAAVIEARRAVKLGLKGAFARPNPHNGRHLDSPAFDPLWSALQDIEMPLALHPAGTPDMWGTCTLFREYSTSIHPFQHSMNFSFDDQFAFSLLVGSGVLERFPRLKVAVLEAGGGWVPYWFDRMDHFCDVWRWNVPHLKHKPSEYFKRQCWVSFDPDERSLPAVASLIGEDRIVWASDYPHLDVTSPCIGAEVRETLSPLPKATRRAILWDNAARLYGF
ncbi:MAG: amidohydrolase [Chloroflexi bacterium]|nr:amidohydrolase [Chloroflexota bacterium]